MIEISVFEEVYSFDNVYKAEVFITDLVRKFFGEDHIGAMDIHVVEKEGEAPKTLGINVGENVQSKDVGPGQLKPIIKQGNIVGYEKESSGS